MKLFRKCCIIVFFLIFLDHFQTIIFFDSNNFINDIIHLNRVHININYMRKYIFIKVKMNKFLLIKNEHKISIDEKFCDFAKFYKNKNIIVN